MAKSRADGTPAKAGRKTSSAKAKPASPEGTTRSSPRRSVPSTKAQEAAAADHVQTGRVTKKTSPSKATTSAKKASPAKKTKASPAKVAKSATPAKKAASVKSSPVKSSPTKASPAKAKEAVTSKDESDTQAQASKYITEAQRLLARDRREEKLFAHYVKKSNIIEKLATSPLIDKYKLAVCYDRLLDAKAQLDGNARKTDSEQTRELRPVYRNLKKTVRGLVGDALDEFLKRDLSIGAFSLALFTALDRVKTFDTEVPRDSIPDIRLEDAVRDKKAMIARIKQTHERVAQGLKSLTELIDGEIAAGRIVKKPAGRAASRSRSPARSPVKREREASMSRPVRTRSQSPAKAPARRASKSPAPTERARTRSKSPSKVDVAQPTATDSKKSRSKSPAKPAARQASKSLAPIENPKTRSKSPAKAATAQPSPENSPGPVAVAKTRSRSPAKANNSSSIESGGRRSRSKGPVEQDGLYKPTEEDEQAPQQSKPSKKSPTKRSASTSARSPSPSKRSKAPSSLTKEPTSRKSRSKSPIKKPSPKKPATNPYTRPHPPNPSRGTIISPTNPQLIASLNNKPNPFHETLPAPEIWHRRMPPYFPFGETPYMEREISFQIEADLARSLEETQQARQKAEPSAGLFKRASSFVSDTVDAVRNTFSPAKPRRKVPSAWELPGVSEGDVERNVPLALVSSGKGAARQVSAPRIQRRYSGDDEDEYEYGSSDDGTSGLH